MRLITPKISNPKMRNFMKFLTVEIVNRVVVIDNTLVMKKEISNTVLLHVLFSSC